MSTVTPDSRARIARTAVQSVSAAVLAAPVVVGALGLSAARGAAVEAVIAGFVAAVSAAQNVAEDFGVLPFFLRFTLPTPAAKVPAAVAADAAKAEAVAAAAAAVVDAAKGGK